MSHSPPSPPNIDPTPPPPINILHRDAHILVVDKPGGLLVHRSSESTDRDVLLQRVREQTGKWLYPVHRLDRAASGALCFALSSDVARDLQTLFQADAVDKEYLVLVRGSTASEGESTRPLTSDKGTRQAAHTTFRKLAELSRCSLLSVRIHTGRRHQIRRHLAHLGHQVIGDTTYGKGKINRALRADYGLPRLFLHAWRLSFEHPRIDAPVHVAAPLAKDLTEFIRRLPDAPRKAVDWLPPQTPTENSIHEPRATKPSV